MMLSELEHIGSRMDDVRRAFSGEEAQGEENERFDPRRGPRDVWEARWELKKALRAKHKCSPEEARRIAEILRRAAAEIGGRS